MTAMRCTAELRRRLGLGELAESGPLGWDHPAEVTRRLLGFDGTVVRGPWPPGRRA